MRLIYIDVDPILPILNTSATNFAMWVKLSWNDIPTQISVTVTDATVVAIRLTYRSTRQAQVERKIGDVLVLASRGRRLEGFDLPVAGFRRKLRELIDWLRDGQNTLNMESQRNNYRLVASLLQAKADTLFVPHQ